MSEPGGGFLRTNNGAADAGTHVTLRQSRRPRDLNHCAPYFVDADALEPAVAGAPIGGLTVVAFPNNHLQYALNLVCIGVDASGRCLVDIPPRRVTRRFPTSATD
jgi:surfeit locus 1 family protein